MSCCQSHAHTVAQATVFTDLHTETAERLSSPSRPCVSPLSFLHCTHTDMNYCFRIFQKKKFFSFVQLFAFSSDPPLRAARTHNTETPWITYCLYESPVPLTIKLCASPSRFFFWNFSYKWNSHSTLDFFCLSIYLFSAQFARGWDAFGVLRCEMRARGWERRPSDAKWSGIRRGDKERVNGTNITWSSLSFASGIHFVLLLFTLWTVLEHLLPVLRLWGPFRSIFLIFPWLSGLNWSDFACPVSPRLSRAQFEAFYACLLALRPILKRFLPIRRLWGPFWSIF